MIDLIISEVLEKHHSMHSCPLRNFSIVFVACEVDRHRLSGLLLSLLLSLLISMLAWAWEMMIDYCVMERRVKTKVLPSSLASYISANLISISRSTKISVVTNRYCA